VLRGSVLVPIFAIRPNCVTFLTEAMTRDSTTVGRISFVPVEI
jgi:hypothetical protein